MTYIYYEKKIELDIKKNLTSLNFYKNKKKKIQEYLLKIKRYIKKYIFLLYKKYLYGIKKYIIKVYINFILMLQVAMKKQNFWVTYFKKKIRRKYVIYNRLYSTLEQWKILESRFKYRIKKKRMLTEQREENIMCLNIYNIYLK
ncbi:Flagellar FliJ protein [Buchnera aphidicola (Cinara strobi)]|uniref:Flagellar FliJ protein n=2 Tax=Buchnera aphidicola TaxID=9 RepID=A0A3B1E7N0_9GAMM|nr:Flagellar FliJ protein [Buchnera aphidicola (Cinara strobi)]